MIKDEGLLRAAFALKGLHRQVDIADALDMSANSIVRLFQGKPIRAGTARRIAKLVERDVDELFEDGQAP